MFAYTSLKLLMKNLIIYKLSFDKSSICLMILSYLFHRFHVKLRIKNNNSTHVVFNDFVMNKIKKLKDISTDSWRCLNVVSCRFKARCYFAVTCTSAPIILICICDVTIFLALLKMQMEKICKRQT